MSADTNDAPRVMVIRGSEWARRGHLPLDHGNTLLNRNGTRCCVGIYCRMMGVADERIFLVTNLDQLRHSDDKAYVDAEKALSFKVPHPSAPDDATVRAYDAMAIINDALTNAKLAALTDDERIERLRPLFAQAGVEIDWRPNE